MSKLITCKLIERIQSWPFAVYKLTEKGKLVKEKLVQSEQPVKTEWRCHNLILGFRILRWGSWNFGATTPMMHWSYQSMKILDCAVHVQTTGLIKVYVPEEIGEDPEAARMRGTARAQEVARWFIDKYDMELSAIIVIRKGEKELLHSQDLAHFLGRIKTDDIFVNASCGDECLEEKYGKNEIERLLDLPKRLDDMERILASELVPSIRELSRQLALHLEVENRIGDGINEFREEVRGLNLSRAAYPATGRGDPPASGHGGHLATATGAEMREKPEKRGLEAFNESGDTAWEIVRRGEARLLKNG